MNLNEYFKDAPEKKWKYLCFRFVRRNRRLNIWQELKNKGTKCPDIIVDREKHLIQEAYEEMRDACLADSDYLETWEHKNSK